MKAGREALKRFHYLLQTALFTFEIVKCWMYSALKGFLSTFQGEKCCREIRFAFLHLGKTSILSSFRSLSQEKLIKPRKEFACGWNSLKRENFGLKIMNFGFLFPALYEITSKVCKILEIITETEMHASKLRSELKNSPNMEFSQMMQGPTQRISIIPAFNGDSLVVWGWWRCSVLVWNILMTLMSSFTANCANFCWWIGWKTCKTFFFGKSFRNQRL